MLRIQFHTARNAIFAALALGIWIRPAHAINWVDLDNGWAYDRDSVRLDASGGELIFRTPTTGVMVFHTDCDGYAAWAQLSSKGSARKSLFSQSRSKVQPGTLIEFLYQRICE